MEFAGAIGRAFNLDEIASSITFGKRRGNAIHGVHRLVKIANQMRQPSKSYAFSLSASLDFSCVIKTLTTPTAFTSGVFGSCEGGVPAPTHKALSMKC